MPVYRIPVEFRRVAPMERPPAPVWTAPPPRVKWRFEVKAPVWAGLAHDAETGRLFVGTDAGVLHAIDTPVAGPSAAAWTFDTGEAIKARPAVVGDAVYVVSDSGFLHKLDKQSGAERWRAKVDAATPSRLPGTRREVALGPLRLERRRRRPAALRRQPRQAPLCPRCGVRQGALAPAPPATS